MDGSGRALEAETLNGDSGGIGHQAQKVSAEVEVGGQPQVIVGLHRDRPGAILKVKGTFLTVAFQDQAGGKVASYGVSIRFGC